VHASNSDSATLEPAGGRATIVPAVVRSHADVRPPNVLTIVLDCARAKSFGGVSDGRVARTPVLDALARSGTIFPKAVAPSNWTIPSHMSIFTGAYPSAHGLRTFRKGEPAQETTASWVARRGYETAMFTEMVHLVGGYGLESGFSHKVARHAGMSDEDRTSSNRLASHTDALYSPWVRSLLERLPPFVVPLNMINHPQEEAFKRDVCGSYVIDEFEQWIGGRDRERPFHAFFNLVDAHEPYPIISNGRRTGPLARWYARTPRYYLLAVPGLQALVPWDDLLAGYLWSIERADEKVGRILDVLERSGERERTMVLVSSDHGQSFGESGNVFHGCGATDSITRVPLIVAPPAEFSLPPRIDDWVSLTSIDSWVRAVASGRPPFEDDGKAPLPFSVSSPSSEWVYCEGAPASDPNRSLRGIRPEASWNRRLIAAYRGRDKYVVDVATGQIVHWTLGADPDRQPGETFVGPEAARLRAEVFGDYESFGPVNSGADSGTASVETELDRRLKSWGYD
jgi:arylsulfatase A-like enzyme